MTHDLDRPQVFLSFAGNDRPHAVRLSDELGRRGVDAFIDDRNIEPGQDLVLAIDRALVESDFYVLLWSRHARGRPWVSTEWTAALCRDLEQERAFLFVVRLDETPLPQLLTARKYLDVADDWPRVADALAAVWHADVRQGAPVLPAPHPSTMDDKVELYVRNRALSVNHVVVVPSGATGRELDTSVRAALALPTKETKLGGLVGMRFYYQLKHRDRPIPDGPLDFPDGSTIDLEVQIESFGPDGWVSRATFRDRESDGMFAALASDELPLAMARALIMSAFEHLTPRRTRRRRRSGSGPGR